MACLPSASTGSTGTSNPGTGRVEATPEDWRRIHDQLISGERWVIDGMKLGVLPARLAAADTVVFLDLPAWRCPWGVLQRRLRFRGRRLRPDIGVYDRINAEFLRWIWSFCRTARPRVLNLIDQSPCHVVILRSHGQARSFLRSLPDPMPGWPCGRFGPSGVSRHGATSPESRRPRPPSRPARPSMTRSSSH